MILVVLGTEKYSFNRPLLALETYVDEFNVDENIIVQGGYTNYKSNRLEVVPFFKMGELAELYLQARIIISHGGTGSVVTGIKLGKKVIVIPRLKKFGEHIDDHQLELVKAFEEKNYILPWMENVALNEVINRIELFEPSTFISGKDAIIAYVKSYIDNL